MAWACAWPLTAGAQDPVEDEATEATEAAAQGEGLVQDAPWLMGPISVTATRNPIEAFEFPGMVSVVDQGDIKLLQPSTPDDMLKMLPNVQFTGGPRRTSEVPSIRGFSGPDVIVLFDGARQNFFSGHDGRFYLDPSVVKQVEVLRGPSSSLYGSGGTGGVIEFETLDAADLLEPGERYGATLGFGFQSVNDEYACTLTAYALPIEGLDFIGSVTRRWSSEIELGDGSTLADTDDDILSGLVKGGVALGEHHRVEIMYLRNSNDAQEPNDGGDVAGVENGLVEKELSTDTVQVAYGYDNPEDDLLNLDAVFYFTNYQADETRVNAVGGPAGVLLTREVDTFGLRIDNRSFVELTDSAGIRFTYGVEAYSDDQNGAEGAGERDGVPDASDEFIGLFAQAEVDIAEPFGVIPGNLLIIPGLRYDHYQSRNAAVGGNGDEELSPRLGVTYLPTDWLMLFGSYSHAFRAPTFDEAFPTGVHFDLGFGVNRFVSNPGLKAQRTRTWEFGAGLDFEEVIVPDDRFTLKAAQFFIEGKDFIDVEVVQPFPFAGPPPIGCNPGIPGNCNGTTSFFNVPNAELEGTEVEAWYESDRVRLGFAYSRIDGEDADTGDKLGVLTPAMYKADAALKLPELDSIVGWRVIAADHFDNVDDDAEVRQSYVVNDLYFAWAPVEGPLDGLRIDLGVDNIFDESYERVFADVIEPGRNYKAGISYSLTW